MNGIVDWLNATGAQLAQPTLVLILQTSLLFLGVWLLDRLIHRRVHARVRYLLWMVLLLKFSIPTGWVAPFSLAERMGTMAQPSEVVPAQGNAWVKVWFGQDVAETAPMIPFTPPGQETLSTETPKAAAAALNVPGGLFLSWLLGAGFLSLLAIKRRLHIQSRIRRAHPLNRRVRISKAIDTPCVVGLLRPRILLPKSLATTLTKTQLQLVIRHESLHIKRGDLWIQTWQTLLQIVFFFHPLLWLANRRIAHLREMAVDESLARTETFSVTEYCNTLVQVAEGSVIGKGFLPAYPGMASNPSLLHRRVSQLLAETPRSRLISRVILFLLLPLAYLVVPSGCKTTGYEAPLTPIHTPVANLPIDPVVDDPFTAPPLEVATNQLPVQVMVAAQFLTVPEDKADAILEKLDRITAETNGDMKRLSRAISEMDVKMDMLSAPRVITRSGLSATIEVVEEIIHPTGYFKGENKEGTALPQVPEGFDTKHAGVILKVQPIVDPENPEPDANASPESFIKKPIRMEISVTVRELLQFDDLIAQFPDFDGNLVFPTFHTQNMTQSLDFRHGEAVVLGSMANRVRVREESRKVLGLSRKAVTEETRSLFVIIGLWLIGPDGKQLEVASHE